MKHLFFVPVLLICSMCVLPPNAARTNAKLRKGLSVAGVAGVSVEHRTGDLPSDRARNSGSPRLEGDFQYAFGGPENGGVALQLKVPLGVVATALDVYAQAPQLGPRTFVGVGAELSILPGAYAVITHYLTETVYATFTPRILYLRQNYTVDDRNSGLIINPQIAFGIESGGLTDWSLFASYAYLTEDIENTDLDGFFLEDVDPLPVDRAFFVGLAVKFHDVRGQR